MEDSQIIKLFFERSEQAIEELSIKYERLLMKISNNILNNDQDARECVNDTYLGVWNVIPPEKPHPLASFLCKIARNLSLKRYRHNHAKKRNSNMEVSLDELEGCLPSVSVEEWWSAKELGEQINVFLRGLDEKSRILFVKRYWFSESIGEIARFYDMSENAVSIRLNRIRGRLKAHLAKEGYWV